MGGLQKVISAKVTKQFSDPEVEYLLRCNPDRLNRNLSPFYTRPLYAYTKAQVGGRENELSNIRRADKAANV